MTTFSSLIHAAAIHVPGLAELNSVLLDWWLWEEGEKKRGERKHHKTLTVNY